MSMDLDHARSLSYGGSRANPSHKRQYHSFLLYICTIYDRYREAPLFQARTNLDIEEGTKKATEHQRFTEIRAWPSDTIADEAKLAPGDRHEPPKRTGKRRWRPFARRGASRSGQR